MKVTVLSGGVGGARFLRGVMGVFEPGNVSIVGNVADDVEVLGLHISPDLDSILYAIAGLSDENRGWGRADESWNALATAAELDGLLPVPPRRSRHRAAHLVRTQLLRKESSLSTVTARLTRAYGLGCALLPATDQPLRTFLETPAGTFPFQTWFVARGHQDEVDALHYAGAPDARPAPRVIEAIVGADVIVIAPSNPYVSIGPILAVDEIRDALAARTVPCVAVSPIVGGLAVKGPADRMLKRLAGGTSPAHVAGCYTGLIDALVIDEADAPADLPAGVHAVVTQTLMTDQTARQRLARAAIRRCRSSALRIAILGGTGSFGLALATRLADRGEDEVVIGSRDADRAEEAARELGGGLVTGAANHDAVQGADIVVLAVKADAALDTARAIADALGEIPLLSVAAGLTFSKDGVRPDPDALSIAERVQALVRAPVVAGLHSIAAANLGAAPPEEDASICGDDLQQARARARIGRKGRRRSRARRRPARERASARRADGCDREPEQAL